MRLQVPASTLSIFALLAIGAALTLPASETHADETTEVTPIKRIALAEKIPQDETMRVMLYSNEFSLYPRLNRGPIYVPYQGVPGASAGQAALGAAIGMMFVNRLNSSERGQALAFKEQIDEALAQLDIKDELESALAAELQQGGHQHLEFEHVIRGYELAQPGLLNRIAEKNILTLAAEVSFDGELRALCIRASAKLWRKEQTRPLYYSELSYLSPSLQEASQKELRAHWVNNNGELLRTRIQEGLAEVAHMLALDLKASDDVTSLATVNREIVSPLSGKKVKTDFYTVEEKPGRLMGRPDSLDSSLLMSIPQHPQEAVAAY
jgi:hypothetical protein